MAVQQQPQQNSGPNLQALGLKSPMEVIDILALIRVDGQPVVNDSNAILEPNLKAKAVMEYFYKNYNVKPADLPYLASLIKQNLKNGKIGWRQA